jgi:dTDP-4-dehydrorhamnose 3,5-epimerase-like enzyme
MKLKRNRMKIKIDQLNSPSDLRGTVFEPIEKESISAQKNIHVVISKPGAIRGNHYHLYGTETIAVVGPALLRFKEGDDIYDFEIPTNQVYKLVIPPKIAHAIKNTGKKDNILVAFNTVAHNSKKPDVISEMLMN